MMPPMTSARRFALRLVALGAFALMAACTPISLGSDGPSVDASQPIPVALLVPKGSSRQGDAAVAASLENAARLAVADLSGVRIDLRVYGTGGNAGGANAAAVKAVNEGAKIIVGPLYAESANAAGLAVASQGVNVLAFSNNSAIAGGNVFFWATRLRTPQPG